MGYDPEFINLLAQRIQQLEIEVANLKAQNAPRSQQVQAAVQAESETAQIVGNAISSAYQRIEDELNQLRELPVTPEVNQMINQLIALKPLVPQHFTVSQGDQIWLNTQINNILGINSS